MPSSEVTEGASALSSQITAARRRVDDALAQLFCRWPPHERVGGGWPGPSEVAAPAQPPAQQQCQLLLVG